MDKGVNDFFYTGSKCDLKYPKHTKVHTHIHIHIFFSALPASALRPKAAICAANDTQNSQMRVKRNSSSSLAALVSALSKQTPVVDVPEIWVLFFLCSWVCVCVSLLGLPLAKPSLLHLHFLRSPSLSLALAVEGLMSSLTSLYPPWLSHGTEGEGEEWGKWSLSAITHSSLPWECEKNLMCWQWQIEQ